MERVDGKSSTNISAEHSQLANMESSLTEYYGRFKAMNKKQTVVLWLAIVMVVAIGLYPHEPRTTGRPRIGQYREIHRDTGQMIGYWVATCAVAGGLIYGLRSREKGSKTQRCHEASSREP